jgi:hypothetical protein
MYLHLRIDTYAEKPNRRALQMRLRRNRRSADGRQGAIPVEMPELVEIVLGGMFSTMRREMLNRQRMMSCTMIWTTGGAAVGVCPGYDDFLVWLNPQTEGAMAVPMTAEAVEDFSRNVLPVINSHKKANRDTTEEHEAADVEWLLSTCNKVRDEEISHGSDLPDQPRWEEMPSREALSEAHAATVTALAEFLGRHDAVPDLV